MVETNISVIEQVLINWKFAMGVHHSGFLEELLDQISTEANDKSIAAAIAVSISVLKESENLSPSRWKIEGRKKLMDSKKIVFVTVFDSASKTALFINRSAER